jgi:uncharacterized membrane protein (DUF106 family)
LGTLNSLLTAFNSAVTYGFDLLFKPFSAFSPVVGLTVVSIIAGVLLLLAYGKVSNQAALKRVKANIHAALLESVLYRHDLRTSLRAQGRMLRYGGAYFLRAVPPLIILAIPCLIVLAQLNLRYEARGLRVGEPAIVNLTVVDAKLLEKVRLVPSDGLVATPPVRLPSEKKVFWRIEPTSPGAKNAVVDFQGDDGALSAPIAVGETRKALTLRASASWWNAILYPSSVTLPSSVSDFSIAYPSRTLKVFGIKLHWIVFFFLVSLVAGLAASKIFHIEI